MTLPADLKPGDRISAEGVNVLTVTHVPTGLFAGAQLVDVKPQPGAEVRGPSVLADATGARLAHCLGPSYEQYRLYFDPATDVAMAPEAEG